MPEPTKSGGKKWTAETPAKKKKMTREQKKKAREEDRKKKRIIGRTKKDPL